MLYKHGGFFDEKMNSSHYQSLPPSTPFSSLSIFKYRDSGLHLVYINKILF
jgi:hypothetical protein